MRMLTDDLEPSLTHGLPESGDFGHEVGTGAYWDSCDEAWSDVRYTWGQLDKGYFDLHILAGQLDADIEGIAERFADVTDISAEIVNHMNDYCASTGWAAYPPE